MQTFNSFFRDDQRRGASPGGARLQDAGPPGLPPRALRHHARVLAQGPHEEADVRDPPVEAGGLFHHVRLGL